MAIDHSLTYTQFRVRNIPHILRLRKIKQVVVENSSATEPRYADVGCSNGYITNIISRAISAKATAGFDHSNNLIEARKAYPDFDFTFIDLNKENAVKRTFDIVTCFETLEHVGKIEPALDNLMKLTERGGKLILSVPIEIGAWGLFKYLAKRFLYRYELPLDCSDWTYFIALIKGEDISRFRPSRNGFGSHFGFDYRVIDRYLAKGSVHSGLTVWNSFTTRFYVVDI